MYIYVRMYNVQVCKCMLTLLAYGARVTLDILVYCFKRKKDHLFNFFLEGVNDVQEYLNTIPVLKFPA